MEIICTDPYYDTEFEEIKDYKTELLLQLEELDCKSQVQETDIGHGAGWPVYLIKLFSEIPWEGFLIPGGGVSLFFLGNQINQNLDAWVEIARKTKRIFKKIRPSYIDEKAAVLVLLEQLAGIYKIDDIKITIQVIEGAGVPRGTGVLDKRPQSIYIITAKFSGTIKILVMASNSKVLFENEYSTRNFHSHELI